MIDGLFALLDGAEAATNPKNSRTLRIFAAGFCVLMLFGLIAWVMGAWS